MKENMTIDEQINEVLSKDATAGDWIHDFVHSDNPKFGGKSKEKRKQMALAAYYAKQQNEQAPVAPSIGVHRIAVTTSEPDHPMVTKRKETTQRFVRVTAHDKNKAIEQGKKHFAKKGFKVHGAEHSGMVHEETEQNKEGTMKSFKELLHSLPLQEANHREFAAQGLMHPDMSKHMTVGKQTDYYEPKTGNKISGKVMHKSDTEVHMKQTADSYDDKKVGSVHKFKVSSKLDEAQMTTTKDKSGKVISFKYEGDWKKSDPKKNPEGKVHNLAGKAMQKMTKANEEVEQVDESIKTTHENPLVTVHDKNGLHTHANLSVANDIFGTNVKHSDVHKGEVSTKGREGVVRFNISKHHENAMKEEVEKESKKDFDDRQKRLAAASNETAKDPERLKKLSKIPGYTAAMDLAKKADRRLRMRTEEKDEQEYGYEGDMALNQLKTLVRCAEMIEDMLKPDTDLPEWVQSKITLATDYIQTAADYMYSEMNEELKGNQHKLDKNHNGKVDSGDFKILRGEECPECHKAPCECGHMKEETDVERRTLSFNEFMSQLNEYTPGPGGVTRVQGRSYGAQYRDPEGEDDADEKKKQVAKSEPAVKRGRGRPAGSKSGANQKVTNGRKGSGVDYTGYKLHLPNSNR